MSDINLLPVQDRAKEDRERTIKGKHKSKLSIELTSPDKYEKQADKKSGSFLSDIKYKIASWFKKDNDYEKNKAEINIKDNQPTRHAVNLIPEHNDSEKKFSASKEFTFQKNSVAPQEVSKGTEKNTIDLMADVKHKDVPGSVQSQPEHKFGFAGPLPQSDNYKTEDKVKPKVTPDFKLAEDDKKTDELVDIQSQTNIKNQFQTKDKKQLSVYPQKKQEAKDLDFNINLIPGQVREKADIKLKLRILSAVVIICLVVPGGIFLLLKKQINNRRTEISNLENQINSVAEDLTIQNKASLEVFNFLDDLEKMREILSGHTQATKVFDFLEKYTIDAVYFTNMSTNFNDGIITLNAAAESYQNVTEQLTIFKQAENVIDAQAKEVKIVEEKETINLPNGETEVEISEHVGFTVVLQFLPDFFKNF